MVVELCNQMGQLRLAPVPLSTPALHPVVRQPAVIVRPCAQAVNGAANGGVAAMRRWLTADLHTQDREYLSQCRLLELMKSTGYAMEQRNGQRCTTHGSWKGAVPGQGCEIFIGKIPRDTFEDTLLPLLLTCGDVYELRLMMDFSGTNRGFAFACFRNPEQAEHAVQTLNGYAIRQGKYLGVMKSLDNRRLFVGGLPKDRTKEEVLQELSLVVDGIVDVILYNSVVDKSKNRGFAFVEFESHRVAAIARRKMIPGGVVMWGHELAVDWAEPEPEVDAKIMAKVKVLYMRNLMLSTSEQSIRAIIEQFVPAAGVEKVKKIKDFAFLHFTDRDFAEQALRSLDNRVIDGSVVSVVWAKPPRDKVQQKDKTLESVSSSDDNNSCPRGRPILPAPSEYQRPLPQRSSSTTPLRFWQVLTALCGGDPPATISSWKHPFSGEVAYLAQVTVPFISQPFCGNYYTKSPEAALEAAAQTAVAFLNGKGGAQKVCHV